MPARVITVAQQKGGSGKSTMAIHLATAFAKMGYNTMLFDTDPQGTSSHWHAQRKKNDMGLLATSGWRLTRDLAMAKEANDIIIIDSPPHAEMDIKVSTRAADLVIVPMQPSPADMWAVRETMKTLTTEASKSMIVLNRVVPRAKITEEITSEMDRMGFNYSKNFVGNRVLFAAAMEEGLSVLDGFNNQAATEINGLVQEVCQQLGIQQKGSSKKASTSTAKAKKATSSATKKKASTTKAKSTAKKSTATKKASSTTKTAAKKAATKTTAKKTATKSAAKSTTKKASNVTKLSTAKKKLAAKAKTAAKAKKATAKKTVKAA